MSRSAHSLRPMPTNYTDDLRLAHVLADDADSLSTNRFQALDLRVDTKPDLTPVTDADRAVEEGIRRTLSRARPRDAVLGEEQGSTGSSQRRWVVDPIDGTKNFVRGVPVWATLISLMVEDEVVVGRGLRADAAAGAGGRPRAAAPSPASRCSSPPSAGSPTSPGSTTPRSPTPRWTGGRARPARRLPGAVPTLLAHPGVRRLLELHAGRRGRGRPRRRAGARALRHGGARRDRARGRAAGSPRSTAATARTAATRWPATASSTRRCSASSARRRGARAARGARPPEPGDAEGRGGTVFDLSARRRPGR